MRPLFQMKVKVRSYETDPHGRLQVPILCQLLQEAATAHASELGVSVESLIGGGLAWVLSRLRLTVERWPRAGETIEIVTWPEALDRLLTERRFAIKDASGVVAGSATTLWLVLDLERRRPVRIPASVVEALSRHDLGSRPVRPTAIDPPEELDCETAFSARRSDVDLAGHVNNTSYVEWVIEGVPDEVWSALDLTDLDVSFLSECQRGDRILSACRVEENEGSAEIFHRLTRTETDETVIRARSVWGLARSENAGGPIVLP